jgi:hypothetical protein
LWLLLLLCWEGTISAPPDYFGETLEEEQLGGGSFVSPQSHSGVDGGLLSGEASEADAWARLVEREVGHACAKLYGGSQYHRSLREFSLAVQHMSLPEVTPDEIANAAGVNDVHGELPLLLRNSPISGLNVPIFFFVPSRWHELHARCLCHCRLQSSGVV